MPRPVQVKPLENYRLWVKFSDGVEGTIDLSYLVGNGVFALWNDYQEFQKVRIGSSGEIAWSEDIDICPDAIYLKITGQKPEDLFPRLRELSDQYA